MSNEKTPTLSELLKQYGEACGSVAWQEQVYGYAVKEDGTLVATLFAQITSLFASATEAGARIERAECAKVAENEWMHISGFGTPDFLAHQKAGERIARRIRERSEGGTQ